MTKYRLDQEMVKRGLVNTRSQAESWIGLGKVTVNGVEKRKSGVFVADTDIIELHADEKFVSRAALKLASVADKFAVDFEDKVVLDIGSSTGGFTEYALRRGAKKVFAVDVGTNQLHPSLRSDTRIELHEKTDIRDFTTNEKIDVLLADVSFISLRDILPHVRSLMSAESGLVAMVKPQFEAGKKDVAKGVIKNDTIRRKILHDFEKWVKNYFVIVDKADSEVTGSQGNRERFYLLRREKN